MAISYKQKEPAPAKDLHRIDTSEVCLQLACSKPTLWRYCRDKQFPKPLYLGNKKLWLQTDVDAWVKENLKAESTALNLPNAA